MSGTSQAVALVAGCAAILREVLVERGQQPLDAPLIKALLINGATILERRAPKFVPNNNSAFGRANLADSIQIVLYQSGAGFHEHTFLQNEADEQSRAGEQSQADHQSKAWFSISAPVGVKKATLKVTLVWSDYPGHQRTNRLFWEIKYSEQWKRACRNDNNVQQILVEDLNSNDDVVAIVRGQVIRYPQEFAIAFRFI